MIRVFCDCCSAFLRVAKQDDIKGLQEHEFCQDCKEAINEAWLEIELITKQQVKKLDALFGRAKRDLEKNLQRVIDSTKKGEK